jgi:hypothetical protein
MSRADRGDARPPLSIPQLAGLIVVVLAVVVVVDFSQRLAASQRLVESADQVATEVAQLERERSALQTQVAYATTDAAVVAWAHEHGRMVRPGEVLVVPIIPTAGATPPPAPVVLPSPPPNWSLWWTMFFR